MTDIYEGDPRIVLSEDGATLRYIGGQPRMDQGLENQALISLFTDGPWPGNTLFEVTQEQIGSDFEEACRQPITLQSINNIRNAAIRALNSPIFGTVNVEVSNPLSFRLDILVTIEPPGQDAKTLFLSKNGLNWIAQAQDPAHRRI